MTSVSAALAGAARRLGSAAEARTLLASVLGVEPAALLLRIDLPSDAAAAYAALLVRRREGVPVQHLTGRAHFRTVSVRVGPGVFVPRPETEVMTGWALGVLAERARRGEDSPLVVELCAGSGAIALALTVECPAARVHAVEISDDAWPYLVSNLAGTSVACTHADMADALGHLDGTIDLVIANPPYIPLDAYADLPIEVRDHDPAPALFAGEDGLDAIRVVADVAARLLRSGGWVGVEHADLQGESAPEVFLRHGGYDAVQDRPDLNDRPRFVVARRSAGRMER